MLPEKNLIKLILCIIFKTQVFQFSKKVNILKSKYLYNIKSHGSECRSVLLSPYFNEYEWIY